MNGSCSRAEEEWEDKGQIHQSRAVSLASGGACAQTEMEGCIAWEDDKAVILLLLERVNWVK